MSRIKQVFHDAELTDGKCPHRQPIGLLAGMVSLAILISSGATAARADDAEHHFERRVAPILSERCASCHNPEKHRGGLDVTSRAALVKEGVIVPGKPDESWLLDLVSGDEPEMPKDANPLTAEQVGDLRKWIEAGAKWPESVKVNAVWWSLRHVERPKVPTVKHSDRVATPIDAFVLRRLEEEGLKPAPRADRITLIRRATFDLHGLPPTPKEIDDFLADTSPNAFARVVERLLSSPRYGERWGRHWLDLASYADSHGYELDYPRPHAWRYRDYVIQAFNDDLHATALHLLGIDHTKLTYFHNGMEGRLTNVHGHVIREILS